MVGIATQAPDQRGVARKERAGFWLIMVGALEGIWEHHDPVGASEA